MKLSRRTTLIALRTFFSLLTLSAVVTEIATLSERGTFNAANFFSYFTIQANVFAALVLFMGAFVLVRGRESARLHSLRGAATLYMVVTGIVFSSLLAGMKDATFTAVPWDNFVLHYLMPVVVLADWLIDPPASVQSFKRAWIWLLYPATYVIYSLIRGGATDWYPYPFLNPGRGMDQLGFTCLGIAALGVVLVFLLGLVRPRKGRR